MSDGENLFPWKKCFSQALHKFWPIFLKILIAATVIIFD